MGIQNFLLVDTVTIKRPTLDIDSAERREPSFRVIAENIRCRIEMVSGTDLAIVLGKAASATHQLYCDVDKDWQIQSGDLVFDQNGKEYTVVGPPDNLFGHHWEVLMEWKRV